MSKRIIKFPTTAGTCYLEDNGWITNDEGERFYHLGKWESADEEYTLEIVCEFIAEAYMNGMKRGEIIGEDKARRAMRKSLGIS